MRNYNSSSLIFLSQNGISSMSESRLRLELYEGDPLWTPFCLSWKMEATTILIKLFQKIMRKQGLSVTY
jgi:hypothetical protein